ncbi:MAG: hypothetical protein AAGA81_09305 [Acidobacteriota bacterium]
MALKVHTLGLETAGGDTHLDPATRAAASSLAAEIRGAGLHVGWLCFEAPEVPDSLAECGAAGALRSVQIGEGGSLIWKPRSGEPVLEDLLREHCAGCRVVFVERRKTPMTLRFLGDGRWRLSSAESTLELDGGQLAARLRRPRLLGT